MMSHMRAAKQEKREPPARFAMLKAVLDLINLDSPKIEREEPAKDVVENTLGEVEIVETPKPFVPVIHCESTSDEEF